MNKQEALKYSPPKYRIGDVVIFIKEVGTYDFGDSKETPEAIVETQQGTVVGATWDFTFMNLRDDDMAWEYSITTEHGNQDVFEYDVLSNLSTGAR